MSRIPTATVFGFATEGEALAVANKEIDQNCAVAQIVILRGTMPAELPVAWIVIPSTGLRV